MYGYLQWKRRAIEAAGRKWFLPFGITMDKCIAAYRFKGAKTQAESQHDMTEHGYNLTYSSVDWDTANGLKSGTITQTALADLSNVVTQVVSYSNFVPDSYGTGDGRFAITDMKFNAKGVPALCLYMTYPYKNHASTTEHVMNDGHWGALLENGHEDTSSGSYTYSKFLTTSELAPASGIVAVDKNNKTLWRDGVQKSASEQTATFWDGYPSFLDPEGTNPVLTSYRSPYRGGGTAYIKAAVFFSCSLSADQHAELVEKIALL